MWFVPFIAFALTLMRTRTAPGNTVVRVAGLHPVDLNARGTASVD